jgi:hypothetical protein
MYKVPVERLQNTEPVGENRVLNGNPVFHKFLESPVKIPGVCPGF